MAHFDLIVSLVRAGATGDREMLKSAAEAIMADERAKKHHILADRVQRALSAVTVTPSPLTHPIRLRQRAGREAIIEVQPRVRLDDLLPDPARADSGRQLVEEHVRRTSFALTEWSPGTVFSVGAPGNGKTSFRRRIAEGWRCLCSSSGPTLS